MSSFGGGGSRRGFPFGGHSKKKAPPKKPPSTKANDNTNTNDNDKNDVAAKTKELGNQMEELLAIMLGGGVSAAPPPSDANRNHVSGTSLDAKVNEILAGIGAKKPAPKPTPVQVRPRTRSQMKPNAQATPAAQGVATRSHRPVVEDVIEEDTDNYDTDDENDVTNDDDDDDHGTDDSTPLASKKPPSSASNKRTTRSGTKRDTKPQKKQKKSDDSKAAASKKKEEETPNYERYKHIPLGKAGAQMLTTFGDGPSPDPKTVEAALMGTRKCLQVAVMDARALRRADKKDFLAARQTLNLRDAPVIHSNAVDNQMVFMALTGNNKLGYNPKCGFDVDQLHKLFPEEMRAYMRWVLMHDSCDHGDAQGKQVETLAEQQEEETENGDDDDDDDDGDDGSDEKDDTPDGTSEPDSPKPKSKSTRRKKNMQPPGDSGDLDAPDPDAALPLTEGHLFERTIQFDLRTNRMKEDWYLKFAKVRQGSLLGRRGFANRKSAAEAKWDSKRNSKSRKGKRSGGNWESMTSASVRFLHWLGFEPEEVPPPNEDTTQALAFLGYDFMGKIVEKAIFLRNIRRRCEDGDDTLVLSELRRGEQLTVAEIDKAMREPDVCPTPLFASKPPTATADTKSTSGQADSTNPMSAQLYFGPGFEERLEAEIDALVSSDAKGERFLSAEEKQQRAEDAVLLSRMQERPPIVDCIAHLTQKGDDPRDLQDTVE